MKRIYKPDNVGLLMPLLCKFVTTFYWEIVKETFFQGFEINNNVLYILVFCQQQIHFICTPLGPAPLGLSYPQTQRNK